MSQQSTSAADRRLWTTPEVYSNFGENLIMGIRYYAYPVGAGDAELARVTPVAFMSADPLFEAWSEDPPEMLYLDKCWSYLQRLLCPEYGETARPAYDLVAGDVVHHFFEGTWEAVYRALDPSQVAAVAADLATVTNQDVAAMLEEEQRRLGPPKNDDYGYMAFHLDKAKEFTARLGREGRGLVYKIG